jgi:soluble lytic murein transglycosylase-like protein
VNTIDQIRATAQQLGVDPNLAVAVATKESSLNPGAVSPTGALGLFQLLPSTAAGLGVDPYDVNQNIAGGITYLKQMLQQFGGNVYLALSAYNAGPGTVSRGTIPASTSAYADSIMAMAGYGAGSGDGGPIVPDYTGNGSTAGDSGLSWVLIAGLVVLGFLILRD